jgi:hypothetical protein
MFPESRQVGATDHHYSPPSNSGFTTRYIPGHRRKADPNPKPKLLFSGPTGFMCYTDIVEPR